MAGKDKVPLAARVFEHLRCVWLIMATSSQIFMPIFSFSLFFVLYRYDRVRRSQQMGESTRNKWHKKTEDEGKDVELPFPEWLLNFDAERHAHSTFTQISEEMERKGYTRPNVHLLYHVEEPTP